MSSFLKASGDTKMKLPRTCTLKNSCTASASQAGGWAQSTRILTRLLLAAAIFPLLAWQLQAQAQAQASATQEFPSEKGVVVVDELLTGLDHPWSMAFLPDGS